jgi:Kdo2-lipid IVA lauroyltransferase/acyltransferase
VKARHALEMAGVRALAALARSRPWRASLAAGERLGELAYSLGVRRAVAADNLARAFPAHERAWREGVLREHYRELGRVVSEYARLVELATAPPGEVVESIPGFEHLERALALGRGCVFVTAHFGNFELAGAVVARRAPLDFVYKPMSNPAVEAWIGATRARLGVGLLPVGQGRRGMFEALRAGRVVCLVADQDARRHGVFVPFLGRPASTFAGPAQLALRTGAPLMFGVDVRLPDGRHRIVMEPPLAVDEPAAPDAVERLTALHAARLEAWVREYPSQYFWLHRRWKTQPPAPRAAAGG